MTPSLPILLPVIYGLSSTQLRYIINNQYYKHQKSLVSYYDLIVCSKPLDNFHSFKNMPAETFAVKSMVGIHWWHMRHWGSHIFVASQCWNYLQLIIWTSYTLGHEYRVIKNRYSWLLFTSEDRLCANLRVQEQSTNMTSQC